MGLLTKLLGMFLGRRGGMLMKLMGGPLLGIILSKLKNGGLSGMLGKARSAGLSDKADSWISTGPNQPLDPSEVDKLIEPEEIERIANETGLSVDEVKRKLAEGLPEVVNQATPQGQVPDDNALSGILDKLSRFLPR